MKLFLKAAAAALLLLATAIEAKHASASHILVKTDGLTDEAEIAKKKHDAEAKRGAELAK